VRHTRPGIRAWLERLMRVLPALRFEIKHIAVSGWPWATTVGVEWRDFATLADGTSYVNDGAHAIQIRWGKVVVLHAYLDTQIVIDAMRDRLACLMANHGLVAAGNTLSQAIKVAQEIESLSEMFLKALAVGDPVLLGAAEMAEVIERFRSYVKTPRRSGPSPTG
jgi:ribulose-5-phosphate 4-epimerase/fuculose-1-phosphate aldolase